MSAFDFDSDEAYRIYQALKKILSSGDNAFVKADREGKIRIRKVSKEEIKY